MIKKVLLPVLAVLLLVMSGCATDSVKHDAKVSKKANTSVDKVTNSDNSSNDNSVDAYEPFTQDEKDYLQIASKEVDLYDQKMNDCSSLIKEAGKDPSLYSSDEWMNQFKNDISTIAVSYNIILLQMDKNGDVPNSMVNMHKDLENAFKTFGEGGKDLVDGIENTDKSKIDEATTLLQQSGDWIEKVTTDTNDLRKEHGMTDSSN